MVNEILLRANREFNEELRLWKNQTGTAFYEERTVQFGLPGSADITGIMLSKKTGFGVRVEIEVKVGRDKQRESQKNFESMIVKFGGFYFVASNDASAINFLKVVKASINR